MTNAAPTRPKPSEPWRQRLIRSLLYGRNVDRAAKARARVGFRDCRVRGDLRRHRRTADHVRHRRRQPWRAPHRGAGRHRDRAAGYHRPQRRDPRHRRQGAEPVRRAAPHHRQGRGDRASHRDLAGSRHRRSARPAVVEERLRLAEARNHAAAAAGNSPPRHSRHRLPAREQARLSHRQRSRASDRPGQYRQPGHRRHGEMARHQRSCRPASRRLRHRPAAAAGRIVGRSARRARAARRTAQGQGKIPRQGGFRPRLQRQDRRDRGDGVGAGFRSQQSQGGARSRSHQPADHRRLRDGIDLQGLHAGDGAGFRQVRSQLAVGRAGSAALRQVRHP